MSLHTWHCQSPCKPSSCTTFMLNSHWGSADTGKKLVLSLRRQGHFGRVQLFMTLRTVACQASLSGRGVFSKILELIGQYWLPYPSRALYFLLP